MNLLSRRGRAPRGLSRLTARFAAVLAAFLVLLFSGAPAAAAAAVTAPGNNASQVEEHHEDGETSATLKLASRMARRRPPRARVVGVTPVADRHARPPVPLAATQYIPPQRKTLLRLLH